jgi:hypothetical protein
MRITLPAKGVKLLCTLFFACPILNAQDNSKPAAEKKDTAAKAAVITPPSPSSSPATAAQGDKTTGLGVAVTPSSLRYNVKPGSAVNKTVKVTNDSKAIFKFHVNFHDYHQDEKGKPIADTTGHYKYGLSRWVNVSPSFFELKPGETKILTVTVEVPNAEEGSVAAYTIMEIDQVTERGALDPSKTNSQAISMGVIPTIGFGVYLYQNPPNVKNNLVEISKYSFTAATDKVKTSTLDLELVNKGDGIGFCSMYIELTNVQTGVQKKLPVRQFTILPGFTRVFTFPLPADLPKGKYSSVGVMDFGNKEHVEAAELEFTY